MYGKPRAAGFRKLLVRALMAVVMCLSKAVGLHIHLQQPDLRPQRERVARLSFRLPVDFRMNTSIPANLASPTGTEQAATIPDDSARFKRAYALLQGQRDELRDTFKFAYSEYAKWYIWYVGFNLTGLGAMTAVRAPSAGWFWFTLILCIADILAIGTCVAMLKMTNRTFDALSESREILINLCKENVSFQFPSFGTEMIGHEVAKWAIPANAAGLALFASYWGYAAYSSRLAGT